jgi:hypothetical protein
METMTRATPRIGGLHVRTISGRAAEIEDELEAQALALYPSKELISNEKANSEIHAMQGLPQPSQVQVDGQVHDEGRL